MAVRSYFLRQSIELHSKFWFLETGFRFPIFSFCLCTQFYLWRQWQRAGHFHGPQNLCAHTHTEWNVYNTTAVKSECRLVGLALISISFSAVSSNKLQTIFSWQLLFIKIFIVLIIAMMIHRALFYFVLFTLLCNGMSGDLFAFSLEQFLEFDKIHRASIKLIVMWWYKWLFMDWLLFDSKLQIHSTWKDQWSSNGT